MKYKKEIYVNDCGSLVFTGWAAVFYRDRKESISNRESINAGKRNRGDIFMAIQRGDIYYADLTPVIGSEQGGVRPVVIIQNNAGNRYSPTVIVAAITSRLSKHRLPTHIWIGSDFSGLYRNSMILMEQVRTIDRSRLKEYIGSLNEAQMKRMDRAISISLGLKREENKEVLLPERKEEECGEREEKGMALLPY